MRYEEIYDEMPLEMKQMFPEPESRRNTFEDELRNAIAENQRLRQNFSESDLAVVTKDDNIELDYTKLEEEDDFSEDELDFFLELNK